MPSTTTTTLALRTPLPTEAPDAPGQITNLAADVDTYLRVGGAEYCANLAAIQAIPAARTFKGKTAYAADTDTLYRYNGTAWLVERGDGTSGITYSGTMTNFGGNDQTVLRRNGNSVTLYVALNLGANGLSNGGAMLALPVGYRPPSQVRFTAQVYTNQWYQAGLRLDLGGSLFAENLPTGSGNANAGYFGGVTFPATL